MYREKRFILRNWLCDFGGWVIPIFQGEMVACRPGKIRVNVAAQVWGYPEAEIPLPLGT